MSRSDDVTKAHCNRCLSETNHSILCRTVQDDSEVDETGSYLVFRSKTTYEMLKCCGCNHITFRRSYEGDDEPQGSIEYYPPAISRQRPRWLDPQFAYAHTDLYFLLDEVYSALHMGSQRLAMMGLRTVIDMVMLDTVGDVGGFKEKLDALVEKGVVSSQNREFLAAALDIGNAAAHRGHLPSTEAVGQVIDIAENLLQSVYVLGAVADSLRQKTPPRPPRPKGDQQKASTEKNGA